MHGKHAEIWGMKIKMCFYRKATHESQQEGENIIDTVLLFFEKGLGERGT
jgi:hypothetical protein